MRRLLTAIVATMLAVTGAATASPERVRLLEGAGAADLSPQDLAEGVEGYLPGGAIDVGALLQPPPKADSTADKADVALLRAANGHASEGRWQRAIDDDASVYDRFDRALGVPPDRRHLPRLIRVLNRVAQDVIASTGEAKKHFARPRPFQRFALTRVCGMKAPPKPEPAPTKGGSYPSGHSSISWAVALVMMEAAPNRAQALIARAVDYGHSRVVCGLHFPSDIEAGRVLGAAVVDRLLAVPEFRRDLICAKREFSAVAAGEKSEDLPACQ